MANLGTNCGDVPHSETGRRAGRLMTALPVSPTDRDWSGNRAKLSRRYADGSRPLHERRRCEGTHCPWHNPSKHSMRAFARHIRFDRAGLVDRICPHGTGHPDPDSLAFLQRHGVNDDGTHGCDGCCVVDE
jgi:hypothetical protein